MATYSGKIQHNDLEGGFLELMTDEGECYRLSGSLGQVQAGQKVRVTGSIQKGGFGIHMSGPSLEVKSIEVL